MLIRIGYDLSFEFPSPTAMTLMLYVHPERAADLVEPEKIIVEPETPTVIATAQLLREAGSVRDERPAVRADVRKAVDLVLPVAREQERLVESAREQRERVYLSRDLDQVVVSCVLPGTREDALALEPKELRIGVHPRGQRLGDADVRVDLEGVSAHGAAASYALPTP